MSTSGYPEAPPASDVAFDVERFEWTAVDRLEVRGRWTGVRGRRFMRPSLNIDVPRGPRPISCYRGRTQKGLRLTRKVPHSGRLLDRRQPRQYSDACSPFSPVQRDSS